VDKGPLLLELNGRPGIAIQTANRFGLRAYIEPVLAADTSGMNAAERIVFGKKTFLSVEAAQADLRAANAPENLPENT